MHPVEFMDVRRGADGKAEFRTRTEWMCGLCQHEETWELSKRLEFVSGRGWTV